MAATETCNLSFDGQAAISTHLPIHPTLSMQVQYTCRCDTGITCPTVYSTCGLAMIQSQHHHQSQLEQQ